MHGWSGLHHPAANGKLRASAVRRGRASKGGERHPIMQQIVTACGVLGLPINVGKKVIQDFNGAILGGELDGIRGSLGVAPDKSHKFVCKTCALLSVSKASQVACQHWSGLYCFAAGFRRPLFSVLEEIFRETRKIMQCITVTNKSFQSVPNSEMNTWTDRHGS